MSGNVYSVPPLLDPLSLLKTNYLVFFIYLYLYIFVFLVLYVFIYSVRGSVARLSHLQFLLCISLPSHPA